VSSSQKNREVVNITELNSKITQIVARQNELRTAIDEIIADIEGAK
jgi:type I restriction enzyme M protein